MIFPSSFANVCVFVSLFSWGEEVGSFSGRLDTILIKTAMNL